MTSAFAARFAAIDIGSNAIRLVIGERDRHGDIKVLKKVREGVRLGKDVFASGEISEKAEQKIIEALKKFGVMIKSHDVEHFRAVATSALREAKNGEAVIQSVRRATGITIDVIDGLTEGRLIFSAVSHRVDLHEKISLLIDIGGGSVELTIADHGRPLGSQTFKLGTVRLLQLLEERNLKERHLRSVIGDHLAPVEKFIRSKLKGLHIDHAIGTGGNFECLGKLRVALLQKSSIFSMTRVELEELVQHLESMSVKERVQFLRLRPDRADVIIPAALVTDAILTLAEIDVLTIPYVGLRDGILADLAERISRRGLKAVK